MLKLKPIAKEAIPKALVKAKHYRLLNEPWQAESICRDILNIEPDNQKALVYLILSISDRFTTGGVLLANEAKDLAEKLKIEYEQKYYLGIIEERSGKAALRRKTPRAKYIAYEHYRKAMELYEQAERARHEESQDAVLRFNTCVRSIREFKLEPAPDEGRIQSFLDV